MKENRINFYSHILGRSIDVVITGHWGQPVLMFPTSMGGVTQNIDFGLLDTIKTPLDEGKVKVYNVETIDFQSFYAKDLPPKIRIYNYHLYSRFLIEELTPWIQRECNTHRMAVAGCSFGGYHAADFAFKYPDVVSHMFSMSGAFSIKNFMNGYYDDLVYFNSPTDFLANVEAWTFNHMDIILSTSDWDICRPDNVEMSRILASKGINHWYDERRWAQHDWPLWRMVFPEYISRIY